MAQHVADRESFLALVRKWHAGHERQDQVRQVLFDKRECFWAAVEKLLGKVGTDDARVLSKS
jgi:hypothetical protein